MSFLRIVSALYVIVGAWSFPKTVSTFRDHALTTARPLRSLRQRLQLGPGDLRVGAAAEAAVGAGDDIFRTHQAPKAADALGHQLGMLDAVGGVRNHARDEDLAVRQLHGLP